MTTTITINEFLETYYDKYDFIYQNDGAMGYDEAVDWFDDNQTRPEVKKWVQEYIKEVQDFISSDREAAAFAFTCEHFGIGK